MLKREAALGQDEIAFYDALANKESAARGSGHQPLGINRRLAGKSGDLCDRYARKASSLGNTPIMALIYGLR